MNEVIKLLVSMKIRIRRLKKNNVNRCGRSSNLERKISIRRKRRSKNVFEMEEKEKIKRIILIKIIRVRIGKVRNKRRFKIVVIDIKIKMKKMIRDFIGIRVNSEKKRGMVNIKSSVKSRERSGIKKIINEINKMLKIKVKMREIKSKNV